MSYSWFLNNYNPIPDFGRSYQWNWVKFLVQRFLFTGNCSFGPAEIIDEFERTCWIVSAAKKKGGGREGGNVNIKRCCFAVSKPKIDKCNVKNETSPENEQRSFCLVRHIFVLCCLILFLVHRRNKTFPIFWFSHWPEKKKSIILTAPVVSAHHVAKNRPKVQQVTFRISFNWLRSTSGMKVHGTFFRSLVT